MYKVIVVDDEEVIRSGLAAFIDAECPNFEVTETFEDGKEAIEYLQSNSVDVVLTDIRMNEVSGLELAKFIHGNRPETKVVIVSGYKDFEYAKKAIEYRAISYLLKPTKLEEVTEVFARLYETLESERKDELRAELLPILRDQFFYDLMTGALETGIKERFELLDFDFSFDNSAACIVEMQILNYESLLDKWKYEKDRLKLAIINFIKGSNSDIDCFYINFKDSRLFLAIIIKERPSLEEAHTFWEENLRSTFEQGKSLLNFNIEINSMSECVKIQDIGSVFNQFRNDFADIIASSNKTTANTSSETIIQKAKALINDNFDKDISLEDIAGKVFLNPIYFSRYFKQNTGENFVDYLISIRIQKAKELLVNTNLKVHEIRSKVGYSSSKYFAYVFKNDTGLTPTEYRLKHR